MSGSTRTKPKDFAICKQCKSAVVDLLKDRIRRILAVSKKHGQGELATGETQCFQLMEVIAILEGRPTCGVFDDYEKIDTQAQE